MAPTIGELKIIICICQMFGIMHNIMWIGYLTGEFAVARHTQEHTAHRPILIVEFNTVFPREMMGDKYDICVFSSVSHNI
jgi:hypothetical protein